MVKVNNSSWTKEITAVRVEIGGQFGVLVTFRAEWISDSIIWDDMGWEGSVSNEDIEYYTVEFSSMAAAAEYCIDHEVKTLHDEYDEIDEIDEIDENAIIIMYDDIAF